MATTTEYLGLTKPAEEDYVDVGDFNDNMDKIEEEAKNARPVKRGGTGKSSWEANRLMYPSAAEVLAQMAFPTTAGSFLRQDKSGAPYWSTPAQVLAAIGALPDETVPITKGGTGATDAATALANLGGVPTSRTVNGKELTSDITLSARDVVAFNGWKTWGYEYFGTHDTTQWLESGYYGIQANDTGLPDGFDGWGSMVVFANEDGTRNIQIIFPWNGINGKMELIYRIFSYNWTEWRTFSYSDAQKVSGSYTGNGSTTQRSINFPNARGQILFVYTYEGNGTFAMVTKTGAIGKDVSGALTVLNLSKARFSQGSDHCTMVLNTNVDFLNANGIEYVYEVI